MINAKNQFFRLIVLALLLAGPFAVAQEIIAAEQPEVYQVELIVFKHADQSQTTSEIPRMPEAEMADILDQDLPRLEPTRQAERSYEIVDIETAHWRILQDNQLLLNNVSQRLNALGAYDVVFHAGWLQTAPDVAEAASISLLELGIGQDLAIGNIKLLKRRYLHLAVDVALGGNNRDTFQIFSASKAAPAINESRRIRLENLVYFDQPQFGIIAVVTRSELELGPAP